MMKKLTSNNFQEEIKTVIFNYKNQGKISKKDFKNEFKKRPFLQTNSHLIHPGSFPKPLFEVLSKLQTIQRKARQTNFRTEGGARYRIPSQLFITLNP